MLNLVFLFLVFRKLIKALKFSGMEKAIAIGNGIFWTWFDLKVGNANTLQL